MSNEIRFVMRMILSNGELKDTWNPSQVLIDQATQGKQGGVVVATSTAAVVVPSSLLTTEGYLCLQNIESSTGEFITFGASSTAYSPVGKLKPGEPAIFRTYPGVDFAVRASSSGGVSAKVEYLWLED